MTVHLPTISTHGIDRYRTCPRIYRYAYVDGYEPIARTEPLDFGLLWHDGQEAYWRAIQAGGPGVHSASFRAGLLALATSKHASDEWARIEARALFVGYHARWIDEDVAAPVVAVERSFRVAVEGTHWTLNGRIDVARRDGVMEHKSTTSDISLGASYWTRLRLDGQVSNYAIAAAALDLDAQHCIYDVVRRPDVGPMKATPIEKREYTKPKSKACPECRKKTAPPAPHQIDVGDEQFAACVDGRVVTDPGGKLYANLRENDETLDEYQARVVALIAENPDDFYRRALVVRTRAEIEEAEADVLDTIKQIEASEAGDAWPRNTGACWRYGRFCEFFDVCSGTASLDDTSKFRRRS